MKITKHLHSCLLFEQDGHKLLFDPGLFPGGVSPGNGCISQ
jgi:L-ascorbate metabolism protein UlaG (beta-lactamase superfamily)